MSTEFDFPTISDVDELDALFERSRSEGETIVLFNHDPWCPISARAYKEMRNAELTANVSLIDVSRVKAVTRALTEKTGVRHESPQVIVVKNGTPSWDASHFGITSDAVRRGIDSAG